MLLGSITWVQEFSSCPRNASGVPGRRKCSQGDPQEPLVLTFDTSSSKQTLHSVDTHSTLKKTENGRLPGPCEHTVDPQNSDFLRAGNIRKVSRFLTSALPTHFLLDRFPRPGNDPTLLNCMQYLGKDGAQILHSGERPAAISHLSVQPEPAQKRQTLVSLQNDAGSCTCETFKLQTGSLCDGRRGIGTRNGASVHQSFLKPRPFNTITLKGDGAVRKTSTVRSILGESYFYAHIPEDIADLFPVLSSLQIRWVGSWHTTREAALSFSLPCNSRSILCHSRNNASVLRATITMSRAPGSALSYLLLSNKMTRRHLFVVFEALRRIHESSGLSQSDACNHCQSKDPCQQTYSNGARKLRNRFEGNYAVAYARLDSPLDSTIATLLSMLESYETGERGWPAEVVHGDPVFCNIIMDEDLRLNFIDMRGMHDDSKLCLCGDAVYDLAKCFQSLTGYDYIILDAGPGKASADHLVRLQRMFRELVKQNYSGVAFRDIVMLTASLYASLIPLHDLTRHQQVFGAYATYLVGVVHKSFLSGETDLPWDTVLLPTWVVGKEYAARQDAKNVMR